MERSENNDAEKPVAQLELEAREAGRKNKVISDAMNFILDPDIPESTKNPMSVLAIDSVIREHMKTDSFKKFSEDWVVAQTPIMEALKFEGCTIERYDPHADSVSGVYLKFLTGPYEVVIDAEDSRSMDEVKKRGYLSIKIYKTYRDTKDGEKEEGGESEDVLDLIADDCVRNIQDVERVCRLLQNGKEDEALSIIRPYRDLFPK